MNLNDAADILYPPQSEPSRPGPDPRQGALDFARDEALAIHVPAQRGSATSEAAARTLRASGRQGVKLARLLAAYDEAGARGLTDSEAAMAADLPRQSICSLRAHALTRGWLVPEGTRVGPYGMAQRVHRLTAAGRQEVEG